METLLGSGIQAGAFLLVGLLGVAVGYGVLHTKVKALEKRAEDSRRTLTPDRKFVIGYPGSKPSSS